MMELSSAWSAGADTMRLLALSCTRIAVALMVLPLFSGDWLPAPVRNAWCLVFGLLAMTLQPALPAGALVHANWAVLFLKEAFIGGCLGSLFGSVLWAFDVAGQFIDTQIGATSAQVNDPLSGQAMPLTGAFLGRLANFAFMFSGGLSWLMATLLDSHVLWPVMSVGPMLPQAGVGLLENNFGHLMQGALLVAAPSMVLLFAMDVMLGLVNRFAPQLNVFFLSMSLKAWASTTVLMLMLASMVQQLMAQVQARPGMVLRWMTALLEAA